MVAHSISFMVIPACSASSQRASNPPCSPTISTSFGLIIWPTPNIRTTPPSASNCLMRGMPCFPRERRSIRISGSPVAPRAMRPRPGPELAGAARRTTVEPTPNLRHRQEACARGSRSCSAFLSPGEGARRSMTRRQLYLCSGAFFLRSALVAFIAMELSAWRRIRRRFRNRPGLRLRKFLVDQRAAPRWLIFALVFAAAATSLLELLVRLVMRPMVRNWHTPRTDGSGILFHLSANERVVGSSPSRRKSGRLWPAGTLVLTNLRVWFFPRAHDGETWSLGLAEVGDVRLETGPRLAGGMIGGWPSRLAIEPRDEGGEEDETKAAETFAVDDPEAVLAWFAPVRTSHADETPIPTPRS